MLTNLSYLKMYTAYRKHENFDEIYPAYVNKMSSEVNFSSVKSCLMIGPGEGDHELLFLKQCAPNISKLIAVEPDHESAERLRARLANNLPDVDSQVIETTIQNWEGLDDQDQVDLVMMMQVLYYVKPTERQDLFKKLHEQWLTTGGYAFVMSASRTKNAGDVNDIMERLGLRVVTWEEIDTDIMESGFIKQYAHEIQCMQDFSNLDETFLRYFECHAARPVGLDVVRNILNELFAGGKSDRDFYTFAVFQKAQWVYNKAVPERCVISEIIVN